MTDIWTLNRIYDEQDAMNKTFVEHIHQLEQQVQQLEATNAALVKLVQAIRQEIGASIEEEAANLSSCVSVLLRLEVAVDQLATDHGIPLPGEEDGR